MGSPGEQLRLAAAAGNADQVRVLLKASTKLDPDLEGRTAVHLASANGHLNVVKILLDSGAKVNVLDAAGYSPLHQAATEGHEEIVKLLLKSGCHVDTQDELHGNTASHEAAWKGFSRTLEALCKKGANVYIKNNGGFTPLHLTCQNGHNQCCRVLLLSACKPDVRNSYGDSALHTAARYGHAGVLRILISAFCNVSETNKNGDTALHISAAMGRNKLTRILLEAGCDQKMKNNQGEMARDIAERKEFKEVVKLLDNPPVTLIPIQEQDRSHSKVSKKREKESGTSQESAKEKKEHKKSKKGHKVHFSDKKKKGNVSPYGCHMYPDMNYFPSIKLKSLPQEPLKTGEQYYADLAGNIKKGPRGLGYMCYCAPFFNHVEKKLDANKKELLDHIDSRNDDLKAKITHLEQRTHDQLFSLNQKMKESLALERSDCTERIDRRLFRERQELEQQQERLQSEMKNFMQCNGKVKGSPYGHPATPSNGHHNYHLQNGNVPLVRSKSEDLLSESNSNHNSASFQSSAVTSRVTSNGHYNRLGANPVQCGTKPKTSNHVPNVSRLRMRCMGYPELKRESRSEGDLTSCHTETTDYNQSNASNKYAKRYNAQVHYTPSNEMHTRNNSRGSHNEYLNHNQNRDWRHVKPDATSPAWRNGSIPNQNLKATHVNQSDRSMGYQSDASKISQTNYVGIRPITYRTAIEQNRQFSVNNKQNEYSTSIRNRNGFPIPQSKDASLQSAQQSMDTLKDGKSDVVNTGLENDGSSFV